MSQQLNIAGKRYWVEDTKEAITIADSFALNKLGTGHGEAKLYFGNESNFAENFWNNYQLAECFFLKSDFEKFLLDAEAEYKSPQQEYSTKSRMPKLYEEYLAMVREIPKEVLPFILQRVGVEPPRIYLRSSSEYYKMMRKFGLPKISYLSILKLKAENGHNIYYFKMFIDYPEDEQNQEQEQVITANPKIPQAQKRNLLKARIGQGEYRDKLLKQCPFCPFTKVNDERLLVASHIKPWCKAEEDEKIDPKNGFMFTPTYDKLFDKGFISFEDDGTLRVSPWLSPMNQKRLKITDGKKIEDLPLDQDRKRYLGYHRDNIFKNRNNHGYIRQEKT